MALPLQAVDAYEALRAQVLGGGRCRSGITALLYHGMAQGIALITDTPVTPDPRQVPQANTLPVVASDPALVRLLANMVLRIQSEVQHVY